MSPSSLVASDTTESDCAAELCFFSPRNPFREAGESSFSRVSTQTICRTVPVFPHLITWAWYFDSLRFVAGGQTLAREQIAWAESCAIEALREVKAKSRCNCGKNTTSETPSREYKALWCCNCIGVEGCFSSPSGLWRCECLHCSLERGAVAGLCGQ